MSEPESAWHPPLTLALALASRLVFWMVLFAVGRLFFFGIHAEAVGKAGSAQLAWAFIYGLRLDLSTTAYLLAPVVVAAGLSLVARPATVGRVLRGSERAALVVAALVIAGDTAIYGEWGVKLGYRAVAYLIRPDEVLRSAPVDTLLLGVLQASVLIVGGLTSLRWAVYRQPGPTLTPNWWSAGGLVAAAAVLAITGRGGIQETPVQQSTAYFSSNDALNQGAVNALWNFGHSVRVHLRVGRQPGFEAFDPATARRLAHVYREPAGRRAMPQLLVSPRPNIVLVILESWSSALVEGTNGHQPAAPAFLEMASQGLTFTRHFATGTLSNHGLGAILSGVPSTPLAAWVAQPDLYPRLPHLGRDLARAGFDTRFVFGGDLTYGNIRAYLRHGGFARLVEEADFAARLPRGRLGVHDEHLWPRVLSEAEVAHEPFFIAAYTLSSHPPYDQPGPRPFVPDRHGNQMRNAISYADHSLSMFLDEARRQPWYTRTLFVFVADHHLRALPEVPADSPEHRRIPLVLAGPALSASYRGVRIERVVAQYDLPALLLAELGLSHAAYLWSRHPLATPGAALALFRVDGGFGWISDTAHGVYRAEAPSAGPAPSPAMKALFQDLIRTYR